MTQIPPEASALLHNPYPEEGWRSAQHREVREILVSPTTQTTTHRVQLRLQFGGGLRNQSTIPVLLSPSGIRLIQQRTSSKRFELNKFVETLNQEQAIMEPLLSRLLPQLPHLTTATTTTTTTPSAHKHSLDFNYTNYYYRTATTTTTTTPSAHKHTLLDFNYTNYYCRR